MFVGFIVWIAGVIFVCAQAKKKNRDPVEWGFYAFLLSPILAVAILYWAGEAISYTNDEKEKSTSLSCVKTSDFISTFESTYQLKESGAFTDVEFAQIKERHISQLNRFSIDTTCEAFLAAMLPLKEKGIIAEAEFVRMKDQLFNFSKSA